MINNQTKPMKSRTCEFMYIEVCVLRHKFYVRDMFVWLNTGVMRHGLRESTSLRRCAVACHAGGATGVDGVLASRGSDV